MIVVIADDFSGAAEIGGVAFRHGLTAQVQTEFNPCSSAEVIVVDTNTRSSSAVDAARVMARLGDQVSAAAPELVYKKVDSVLRGPVLAEIAALLKALGQPRALLAPANPSRGRTIVGGRYYIAGVPLDETEFASDPEYPRSSADIAALLGSTDGMQCTAASAPQDLGAEGTYVADCGSVAQLEAWAKQVDDTVLPAGAADFFDAVLTAKGQSAPRPGPVDHPEHEQKALYVCGSASAASVAMLAQAQQRGISVQGMPSPLFGNATNAAGLLDRWQQDVCAALDRSNIAITTIGREMSPDTGAPRRLLLLLVQHVKTVLQSSEVERIYVEGGATASALIRALGWREMDVCAEVAPGVVSLKVPGSRTIVTMKPGSYPWPVEASPWRQQ